MCFYHQIAQYNCLSVLPQMNPNHQYLLATQCVAVSFLTFPSFNFMLDRKWYVGLTVDCIWVRLFYFDIIFRYCSDLPISLGRKYHQ